MELKGRLRLVAEKVPVCGVVGDIGTDHAYLPIYLIQKNICRHAVACDVRQGPVMSARRNIERYGLSSQIDARMGNGLHPLKENEADTIVIAGMGGLLISEILADGEDKAKKAGAIILQPMNGIEAVREWLVKNGYSIFDEELASEGEKIYNVISARWTGIKSEIDEIYYHVGEKLIEKKDPLLERYLNKKIRTYERIVSEMSNASGDANEMRERYVWLIGEFRRGIKEWGHTHRS